MDKERDDSSGTQLVLASFSFWIAGMQIFTRLAWKSSVGWEPGPGEGKFPQFHLPAQIPRKSPNPPCPGSEQCPEHTLGTKPPYFGKSSC